MPRTNSPFIVAVATLAPVLACGHPNYPTATAHPLLGGRLPDVHHRRMLDGEPFDADGLAGKPVLVKFFADYCRPCKQSLPAAERVHESHPDVLFLGIDEDDSVEKAKAVVQRYGLTFPIVHDSDRILSGRFRVSTMPMTFVADASGVVRWVGGESQTEEELRQAVEATR